MPGVPLRLIVSLFGASPPGADTPRAPDHAPAERTGTLPTAVRESSGLAVSRRDPDLLWTHNDSGDQPLLYAVDHTGAVRGSIRVAGIKNRDWEDLASFELDGRAWLLIADVGDNHARRTDCALHIIAEPDPAALSPDRETVASVAWTVPVRYPDGPLDIESVAVDARAGLVYLLGKRVAPHALYTLPLRPPGDRAPTARLAARVPAALIPQPNEAQRLLPAPTGLYRAQPTGMDFAADGSAAAVVTYGDVLIFQRQPGEDWPAAFMRRPAVLAPHGLVQAEGVAFGADNRTVFVTSEGDDSAILRYHAPAP